MRTIKFIVGEYYHIYNRGTDKRIIFNDKWDLERFFQSMIEFNTTDSIGSIYQSKYHKKETLSTRGTKLVDFICYSLNPNHYHFILTPLVENGIEKFIHKLGGGYTRYFNEKNKRTGVLFQGAYKAIHINSDKYLTYLGAYINLNYSIHSLSTRGTKRMDKKEMFWKSSWAEFVGENKENFCNKSILLDRYKNINEYKQFAKSVKKGVISKRLNDKLSLDEDLLIETI